MSEWLFAWFDPKDPIDWEPTQLGSHTRERENFKKLPAWSMVVEYDDWFVGLGPGRRFAICWKQKEVE